MSEQCSQIRTLEITLKSDLCMGSGFAYAGIIDSDIVYDRYGLPYIPARRLKGCIRESAELIGIDESAIATLFGHSDDTGSYSVRIGNAYIKGYDEITGAIDRLPKGSIEPAEVLDIYTNVRA